MISKYAAYLLDVEPTRRRRRPRGARLDGADLAQLEIPQGAAQPGGSIQKSILAKKRAGKEY